MKAKPIWLPSFQTSGQFNPCYLKAAFGWRETRHRVRKPLYIIKQGKNRLKFAEMDFCVVEKSGEQLEINIF